MADGSAIEWTDATWNPIVGCSIVSPGCTNCYAMKMAARIELMATASNGHHGAHYRGTTRKVNGNAVWTGTVAAAPQAVLLAPLKWQKPRRIFVNSMGDLFHESIPDAWIDYVFAVMALAPQHTFQVLTKRAARMQAYMATPGRKRLMAEQTMLISRVLACKGGHEARSKLDHFSACFAGAGPFRNVWLGVSAERQQEADARIPYLLATPAAARFVSCEPLLGPLDLTPHLYIYTHSDEKVLATSSREPLPFNDPGTTQSKDVATPRLDWVIAGGESGPGARPMHPDWARALRDQCADAQVPFFFKQWGEWAPLTYRQAIEGTGRSRAIDAEGRVPPGDPMTDEGAAEMLRALDSGAYTFVAAVGKGRAGRLLDGVEHNGFPHVQPERSAA